MVRTLNWGKCTSCGYEDYDVNFEQTYTESNWENWSVSTITKMVCPTCEKENTFIECDMSQKEVHKILKEQRYIGALFSYGVVPLLLLLDEYEEDGNFEECSIIYNAINYCNRHLKATEGYEELPTKYDSESLSKLKKQFNLFGFKGDTAIGNMPYYIEEIKEMVKL